MSRRQIVVEQDNVGRVKVDQLLELDYFSFSDVGCCVRFIAALDHTGHYDRAGRFGKPLNFFERIEFDGIVRELHAHNESDLLIDLVFFLAILQRDTLVG